MTPDVDPIAGILAPDCVDSDDVIADVTAIPVSLPFTHGGGRRSVVATGADWTRLDLLLVRIETQEGRVGWGEAFGYSLRAATQHILDDRIRPLLVGRGVLRAASTPEELARAVHAYGRGGLVQFALSGVDIALWDLCGQLMGRSVGALLGAPSTEIPMYASLFRYGDPETVASVTAGAREAGFRAVKLHEAGTAAIDAARRALGDDALLATDVNCAWDERTAIDRIRELDAFDLAWVEEPLWPPEDHLTLAAVGAAVRTPLAAGENEPNVHGLIGLARSGAVGVLQPSLAKMGGIGAFVRLCHAVRGAPVRILPHSFFRGPALLATAQVARFGAEEPLVEWMFAETEADLFGGDVPLEGGRLHVPDGPGLGARPDPDVIAEYRCD